MDTLIEVDLGVRGLGYVLRHLRGVNLFCDELALLLDRTEGRVFTLVPAPTQEASIFNFESGGLLPENLDPARRIPAPGGGYWVPVTSLVDERARRTVAQLSRTSDGCCIIDDFNPRWSEPLAREAAMAFGVGEEVYHLFDATAEAEAVAEVLSYTDTVWHGAAAVCGSIIDVAEDRRVSELSLRNCAATALEITCTAYDREGFVIWRRI